MATQMGAMMKRHEELGEMLSSMSDHRTNATLYVLTIVTTLVRSRERTRTLAKADFLFFEPERMGRGRLFETKALCFCGVCNVTPNHR